MNRGHKKAVVAVAHAMLVTAYHLLDRQLEHREPGIDYFERRHAERTMRRRVSAAGLIPPGLANDREEV